MNKLIIGCGVALVLGGGLIAAMILGGVYNNLVDLDEGVKSAWGQVENVYQRRADLIPNLVATVRGARDFERETLEAVVKARSEVGKVSFPGGVPSGPQLEQFQTAQDSLSGALSRLLVVVERYPDLKANANFRDLQAQLEGTENRIAVERRRFNEMAEAFNAARRRFPALVVAERMGFDERAYFRASEGAEAPPTVEF